MDSAEDQKELTLIDHLVELRDRILKCLVAVVVIFLALFYFANDIYTWVALPLLSALHASPLVQLPLFQGVAAVPQIVRGLSLLAFARLDESECHV